jgi:hypothetical protein
MNEDEKVKGKRGEDDEKNLIYSSLIPLPSKSYAFRFKYS